MPKGKIACLNEIHKPFGHGIIIDENERTYIFTIGLFAGLIDKEGIKRCGEINPNDLNIGNLVYFEPPENGITDMVKEVWLIA
ncbi:MAG: hypothetical protein Q7S81_00415 [bacterium]|nr:hypothetical protein [bacterium]